MGHELAQHKESLPESHSPERVRFSDEDAGAIDVSSSRAAVNDNSRMHALVVETFGHYGEESPSFADEIVSNGVTASEEQRAKDNPEDVKEEGGKVVSEAIEQGAESAGIEDGAGTAIRTAAQIARMPHVVALVKAHEYHEAIDYITETLGWSDYVSVLKLVGEHAGLDLEAALPTVAKAVTVGAETADIVLAGLEFQCEGLEAIDDAHKRGERDNRIYLYADAWAEGFLEGAYENAGAVGASQRQAVANGLREGKATAGRLGPRAKEVGQTLLDKYKTEDNAKRAVIDALLKHAGIDGIKLHEGT